MPLNLETLQRRSEILREIRAFFYDRDVLEVATPCLARHTIPEPAIESLSLMLGEQEFFLQTSPEFHIKRLLAEHPVSLYQMGPVFRSDEEGRYHNPEFTLLEWYRIGVDHFGLMEEVAELVRQILGEIEVVQMSYRDAFLYYCDIDIRHATHAELFAQIQSMGIQCGGEDWSWDEGLDLLFSHVIEGALKQARQAVFIYHFPTSKAALARLVEHKGETVAARFELFVHGVELANGFYELNDSQKQRERFIQDNQTRLRKGQREIALDEDFINALDAMPDCSGVALGVDRLIMLACDKPHIKDVIAFTTR